MLLTVTKVNFTNLYDWVFELKGDGSLHYIMSDRFYRKHDLGNPISKKELDNLDVGHTIRAVTEEIDGMNVVIKIT